VPSVAADQGCPDGANAVLGTVVAMPLPVHCSLTGVSKVPAQAKIQQLRSSDDVQGGLIAGGLGSCLVQRGQNVGLLGLGEGDSPRFAPPTIAAMVPAAKGETVLSGKSLLAHRRSNGRLVGRRQPGDVGVRTGSERFVDSF
jgi:hypothetical protein